MRTLSLCSLATVLALSLFSSCGKNSTNEKKEAQQSGQSETTTEVAADGSNIQGSYLAIFETLNGQVNGTLPGSATVLRKDDKIYFYLRLFAGMPKAWHPQGIYTGNRCPKIEDDENGDGFIDIQEAFKVIGKVIVPLDADPGSQNGGKNFYPLGDLSGSYHYERIVNFQRFFKDLKEEDKIPDDNIAKLGPDEGLAIEGQVIMIQGVSEETTLPETVASEGRRSAFQTLPIACGVFKKNDVIPGVPDDGEIPGPVADIEEGQDRPAPDEDWVPTPGTGPQVPGGGSNESDTGDTETSDGEGRVSGGRRGSGSGRSDPPGSTTGNAGSGNSGGGADEGTEIPRENSSSNENEATPPTPAS